MTTPINDDAIQKLLAHAKEMLVSNDAASDLTDNSIKQLDDILNHDHKVYKKEKNHDEEALSGIALSYGAYIGEALRQKIPAPSQWLYGVPGAGGGATLYLSIDEGEIYPVDWIAKQIQFGKRESVYKKYLYFLEALNIAEEQLETF